MTSVSLPSIVDSNTLEATVMMLRNTVDFLIGQTQSCMETVQQLQARVDVLERNSFAAAGPTLVTSSSPNSPQERVFWSQSSGVPTPPMVPAHAQTPVDDRGNPLPVPFMNYGVQNVPGVQNMPPMYNRQREEAIMAMLNTPSTSATPTAMGQVFPTNSPESLIFPTAMPQMSTVMPQGYQINPSMTIFNPPPLSSMPPMGNHPPNATGMSNNNNTSVPPVILEPNRATNDILDHVCMQPWIKELCLKGCKNISNFSALSRLRILWKLTLQGCTQYVDDNVLKLIATHNKRLSRLNLCGCERVMDATPLSQLAYLFDLNLSGCQIRNDSLEAIASGCSQLSRLAINSCPYITSISCIGKLKELKLLYCRYSDNIDPRGIADMMHAIGTNLLTLNVDGIKFSELQVHLPAPSAVKNLNFKDNPELKSLAWLVKDPSLFPALEMLDTEGCTNLSDLSNTSDLPALKTIRLSHTAIDNTTLAELASNARALTTVSVEGCPNVNDFSMLLQYPALTKICVDTQQLSARNVNGLAALQARGVDVTAGNGSRRNNNNNGSGSGGGGSGSGSGGTNNTNNNTNNTNNNADNNSTHSSSHNNTTTTSPPS